MHIVATLSLQKYLVTFLKVIQLSVLHLSCLCMHRLRVNYDEQIRKAENAQFTKTKFCKKHFYLATLLLRVAFAQAYESRI